MKKNYTIEERSNIQSNLQYLTKKITPGFKPTKFDYGDFGIELSQETFFSAYYAGKKKPTYKTISIIAEALSSYIKDDRIINVDDFILPADIFKKLYPIEIINNNINPANQKLHLFKNRLFRCYYLVPGSNNHAMLGYFKLFISNDGSKSAYLLRGLNYFNDSQPPQNIDENPRISDLHKMILGFASPHEIEKEFFNYKSTYNNKEDERIHLYFANDQNVHISKACIKIDFETVDTTLGYKSTMFWNIEPITKTEGIKTVVGGLSLIVDTNDGDRQMCVYKMGLDAYGIDYNKTNDEFHINNKPLYCNSTSMLNELSISSDKTVYTLDRVEDTFWYHYVQDDSKREITSKMYTEEEFHAMAEHFYNLTEKYNTLIRSYQKQYENLEKLVKKYCPTQSKQNI